MVFIFICLFTPFQGPSDLFLIYVIVVSVVIVTVVTVKIIILYVVVSVCYRLCGFWLLPSASLLIHVEMKDCYCSCQV